MGKRVFRKQGGFTIIELMVVMAVIGILAAISIPLFISLKDKAIKGITEANLDTVRRSLYHYMANGDVNLYPRGSLGWSQIRVELPGANLPATEEDAKITNGTFAYASANGISFTVTALSTNSTLQPYLCDPSGVREN